MEDQASHQVVDLLMAMSPLTRTMSSLTSCLGVNTTLVTSSLGLTITLSLLLSSHPLY